jgi:hypothetical protein
MAKRTRTRLIGLGATLAVVLTVVGVSVVRADPNPNLAPVTPAELLASTLAASGRPVSVSGEVVTRVDLGLPALPASLGGGELGPVSALLGSQRYKVWRSPDGLRVAHLLDLGEQTLVANRTEAWWWQSDGMQVEHLVYANLPVAESGEGAWFAGGGSGGMASGEPRFDPSLIAPMALAALAPYAAASVDDTVRVAGRAAYELVLTPTSPRTLIGTIGVAVDAETRLPLRFRITPKGADEPAIELGFTSVSFDPIDPSVFSFTPPEGATVSTPEPPEADAHGDEGGSHAMPDPTARTFGPGFATRIAVRLDDRLPAEASALLPYAGPLASALTIDTGDHTWLLFGFVDLDTLRGDADRLA